MYIIYMYMHFVCQFTALGDPTCSCGRCIDHVHVHHATTFSPQYLVSIPLLMLRPWAFTAMLCQVCVWRFPQFRAEGVVGQLNSAGLTCIINNYMTKMIVVIFKKKFGFT